jgi:hypothetical protein
MPNHPRNTIAEQLNRAQTAISNTLSDSEIQGIVAGFGYGANGAESRMMWQRDFESASMSAATPSGKQRR